MKAIKSEILKVMAVLCLCVCLSSCSENNPIKPEPPVVIPIDTVEFFNWSVDTFAYPIGGLLLIDTNEYYMTSPSLPFLSHYKNGVKTDIDLGAPYFRGGDIQAKNANKIYVAGALIDGINTRGQLRVVENGLVKSYSLPDDSTYVVGDIIIDNDDNLWLGTSKNRIYKFKDGIFKKYLIDSGQYYPAFYLDNTNQLYIFSVSSVIYFPTRYCIHKIVNDSVVLVSEEILTSYGQKLARIGGICNNNDLMLSSLHTFYWFNNERWNPIYTNNDLVFVTSISGFSKDFLICFLNRDFVSSDYVGSILYNNKLFYERNLKLRFSENPGMQTLLNDKVIFIPVSGSYYDRLFIGIKKPIKN